MRPSASGATYARSCALWKNASRWSKFRQGLCRSRGKSARERRNVRRPRCTDEQDKILMGLLIKGGAVANADRTISADVLIEGDKIREVRAGIDPQGHTVVEAAGLLILPGGVDVHPHLDMPFGGTTSADDFETGTRAAAFGGTTTLIDFAIQYKGQPLRQAFDTWMSKAASKAVCDYAFHCIVTDVSAGQLSEMNDLVHEGVTSFKLFMAYPGVFMHDDGSIFKALQTTSKNGGMVCMHAENGSAIDVIVQQALAEGKRAPKYH